MDRAERGFAFGAAEFAKDLDLGEGIVDGELVGDRCPIGIGEEVFFGTFAGDPEAGAATRIAEIGNDSTGFDAGFQTVLAGLKPDFADPGADAAALRGAGLEDFAILAQFGFAEIGFWLPCGEDGFSGFVEFQRGRGSGKLLVNGRGAADNRTRETGNGPTRKRFPSLVRGVLGRTSIRRRFDSAQAVLIKGQPD